MKYLALGFILFTALSFAADSGDYEKGENAEYGPIEAGESVHDIALQLQAHLVHFSVYQILQVIIEENRDIFDNGDIQSLKPGTTIGIEDLNVISRINRDEAKHFYMMELIRSNINRSGTISPYLLSADEDKEHRTLPLQQQILDIQKSLIFYNERLTLVPPTLYLAAEHNKLSVVDEVNRTTTNTNSKMPLLFLRPLLYMEKRYWFVAIVLSLSLLTVVGVTIFSAKYRDKKPIVSEEKAETNPPVNTVAYQGELAGLFDSD